MKTKVALTLIPWAISLWGGLPADQARFHWTLEATREVQVAGPFSLGAGIGLANYGEDVALGIPILGRLQLGKWDIVGAGGVWKFGRPVPVEESTELVFSGSIELGRQIKGIRVAGVFYHISNANTGRRNPGFNGLGIKLGW